MKRFAFSFAALLCVSLIALEARATAKENWTSVRSENFTLVGNASEGEIREVAVRLEQYRSLLVRLFAGAEMSAAVPTTVIVFKNDEAFKPFRPLYQGRPTDVAGYFQPGRDLNYIAISVERKGDVSYGTIFHELVHLFIDNRLRGMPLCFNEGLAEYYSRFTISNGGRKITFGEARAQHMRLLGQRELLPLPTLLAADYESAYYNEISQRSIFYAQSWVLAHYLLHRDGQNGMARFSRFLDLLAEGVSIEDGLQRAFQSDVAEIEKGLKEYIKHVPYPTNVVTFDRRLEFASEMHSARIAEAEAQVYLGDLLLHLNRTDDAEAYLRKALTLEPELARAQATLGMLRVKQQKITEAVELLRRAVAGEPQNYLSQYYYAYALSREGMGEEGSVWGYTPQGAEAMRAALRQAIKLKPAFIEAYRLHAFINLALDEQLDEASALLKRALELAPGRQDILLILAQVHLRQMNFAAARQAVKPIILRAADLKLRERALVLLEDVRHAEELAAQLKSVAPANEERAATTSTSKTASPSSEQAHSGRQRLARRFKGERVRGLLTGIQCMETGIVLFVKVGDRLWRLHGEDLRHVFFVTYVAGLERTVTCGTRKPENSVILTYRPSNNPHAKFDGEAVAVEFVPEDIEIEP